MAPDQVIKRVEDMLAKADGARFDVNAEPELAQGLHKARVRLDLSQKGIAVTFPQPGETEAEVYRISGKGGVRMTSTSPKAKAKPEKPAKATAKVAHTYIPPTLSNDILAVISDDASHIIWLTGPTQCGKTTLLQWVASKLGRKMYRVNCRGDMGSEAFLGEKTVTIDPQTKQSIVTFQKGIVETAMTEGLDENGNEVGEPGILYVDEIAAAPAHVAIVLNRLFESDDARRSLVIDQDGGRVVRSHSGFRIVCSANTAGRGANTAEDMAYSAQGDALDISLLNRVSVCMRMGYDRKIEERIVLEKMGDDRKASELISFRDAIRKHLKAGKLSTPFSTKRLIDVANMFRVFGDLGKAIYYVLFEFLLPEEQAVYNETAVAVLGADLLKTYSDKSVDYV